MAASSVCGHRRTTGRPDRGREKAAQRGLPPVRKAGDCHCVITTIKLDADKASLFFARGNAGRAAAGEGIEDDAPRRAEGSDELAQHPDRLLLSDGGGCRCISGGSSIRRSSSGSPGRPLARSIAVRGSDRSRNCRWRSFAGDHVTDRAQTRVPPRRHEYVDRRPAIEGQHQRVGLHDAGDFREGGFHPSAASVATDGAAGTGAR